MSVDKVSQDLNNALKSGDKAKTEALRLLKSALTNARIKLGHELSNEEFIAVVRKEIKSRIEARDLFANNSRPEQAAKEEFERTTYAAYAPTELSQDEINKIIDECIVNLGDNLTFGQLMPMVMKQVSGRADGKTVSDLVKQKIANLNNKEQ